MDWYNVKKNIARTICFRACPNSGRKAISNSKRGVYISRRYMEGRGLYSRAGRGYTLGGHARIPERYGGIRGED